MLTKTSELTKGEKLLLDRRRKGENQTKAAERHGVTRQLYRRWERDEAEDKLPSTALGKLSAGERCYLQRRRAGQTLGQVSEALSCCRFWVHRMENDEVDNTQLVEHWS